jgi:hypothetical protein
VPAQRVLLGEMTVRVYDRGSEPEWHKDRELYGPWLRYEAELADDPGVSATGWTSCEAIARLVSGRRAVLPERWAVEP